MIELRHIYKAFDQLQAVDDVCMSIEDGTIVGFVGQNGAGKTTTMRILAGLTKPDSGTILLDGQPVDLRKKEWIGYMPDFFGVYDKLKVIEYMQFFSSINHMDKHIADIKIQELLELVKLEQYKERYVDTLSRGMKQRLCLARCLLNSPRLLVLDEPASGLDPKARYEFKELMLELKKQGYTILISSHILQDLAEICTDICIIDKGRIVLTGNVDDITMHIQTSALLTIKMDSKKQEAIEILKQNPLVENISFDEKQIKICFKGNHAEEGALLQMLVARQLPIYAFYREQGTLENLFMKIV